MKSLEAKDLGTARQPAKRFAAALWHEAPLGSVWQMLLAPEGRRSIARGVNPWGETP